MSLPTRQLGVTGIGTSGLGFGCASLLGPRSRSAALSLLDHAHGLGITHFDVARSYSSGEAESVLGEFLSRIDRSSVTVATKFGIEPLSVVSRGRLVRNAARRAMRLSPSIRRAMGNRAARMVQRGAFDVEDARRSLAVSLRELRTDYVDLFLLHDAAPADLTPELLASLDELRQAGHIRAFGIGTDVVSAAAFAVGRVGEVLQFAHAATEPAISEVDFFAPVTYGALRGIDEIAAALADPALSTHWSETLNREVRPDLLSGLMVEWAVETNRSGPVLISTTRPEHLEADARAAGAVGSGPSLSALPPLIAALRAA